MFTFDIYKAKVWYDFRQPGKEIKEKAEYQKIKEISWEGSSGLRLNWQLAVNVQIKGETCRKDYTELMIVVSRGQRPEKKLHHLHYKFTGIGLKVTFHITNPIVWGKYCIFEKISRAIVVITL